MPHNCERKNGKIIISITAVKIKGSISVEKTKNNEYVHDSKGFKINLKLIYKWIVRSISSSHHFEEYLNTEGTITIL